jgi:hypothetical protein
MTFQCCSAKLLVECNLFNHVEDAVAEQHGTKSPLLLAAVALDPLALLQYLLH